MAATPPTVYLVEHVVKGKRYRVLRWRDGDRKLHSQSLGRLGSISLRAAETQRRAMEHRLAEMQRLAAEPDVEPPCGPYGTLGAYRAFYLSVRRPEVARQTYSGLERGTGLLEDFIGEQTPLTVIEPMQARAFAAAMANGELPGTPPFSPGTVRKYMVISRTMLNHAVADGLVEKNPLAAVRLPAEPVTPWRYVRLEQFEAALAVAPPSWRAFLACCRLAGMRRSESAGMTWANIDFGDPGSLKVETGKTRAARRLIPMCPMLRRILLEAFEAARDGAVFVIGRDSPHFGDARVLAGIITRAGIARFLIHWLRKSWCTDHAREGTPPAALQTWAGHASYAVTAKYYTAVLDADFAKAAGFNPGEILRGVGGARIAGCSQLRDVPGGAD